MIKSYIKTLAFALLLFPAILLFNCDDPNSPFYGTGDPSEPAAGIVQTPEFSVETGVYPDGCSVILSCATERATIFYSTESLDDPVYSEYSGPIIIRNHTTIWTYAAAADLTDSAYNRADYAVIADDTGNLIGNGDFSMGETLWYLWVNEEENASAECSFSSNKAHIDITAPGDNTWSMSLQYVTRPKIEIDRNYTLRFDASASQVRNVMVKIGEEGRDLNENGEVYDAYLWQAFSLTTVNQSFTADFTMSNPTDDSPEFAFYVGKEAGDVMIDDVSLTITDPKLIDPSLITDEYLRQAVADSAGVSIDELDTLNEWSLTELEGEEYGISDLSGINQFTGLLSLHLCFNNITSLDPLAGLIYLKHLDVQDNNLNLDGFSAVTDENFPDLDFIGINGQGEPDLGTDIPGIISLLASLPNLESFDIDELGIDDAEFSDLYNSVIAPRANDFYGLSVYHNDLTNTSMGLIANLTNLSNLCIGGNDYITDISVLEGNINLHDLRIWATGVTDLTPLKNLYDAGAFRGESSDISVEYMDLDLGEGTPNRAVVEYLIDHGVNVAWQEGNTTE